MSRHTPGAWKYFKNVDNTFSVIPAECQGFETTVLAEVFTEGIDDPEANARLIAASPELYSALVLCVEALRATEIFMAGRGLGTKELKGIINAAGELLASIERIGD